jgi:hypothetical protein
VAAVLIGGFAVNYYKVTRQTADVDFLTVKEDYEKITNLLKNKGYEPDHTHEIFVRLRGKEHSLIDIDFMFVDKSTLEGIRREGKIIKIAFY